MDQKVIYYIYFGMYVEPLSLTHISQTCIEFMASIGNYVPLLCFLCNY